MKSIFKHNRLEEFTQDGKNKSGTKIKLTFSKRMEYFDTFGYHILIMSSVSVLVIFLYQERNGITKDLVQWKKVAEE